MARLCRHSRVTSRAGNSFLKRGLLANKLLFFIGPLLWAIDAEKRQPADGATRAGAPNPHRLTNRTAARRKGALLSRAVPAACFSKEIIPPESGATAPRNKKFCAPLPTNERARRNRQRAIPDAGNHSQQISIKEKKQYDKHDKQI